MENQILELLKKAEFSPILINTIQGDCIPADPTLGELIFLATYLSPQRYPELVPYIPLLPHYVLINMYSMYEEEDDTNSAIMAELKKMSFTFNEKLSLLGFIDDDEEEDNDSYFKKLFIELVDLCTDFDDCMRIMDDVADTAKEIELVLEKMKTFNPSFEQWLELQESAPNHDARIESLQAMIQIAETNHNLKYWLTIYKCCLSGSDNEKLALENIASFNLTSDDWYDIYQECDEFEDYRICNLAIKTLQAQKAEFRIWLNMFIDTLPLAENETPNPIFLGMLFEAETASVEDYYCMYEYLSGYPQIQILVMQKIMSIADAK
ncbi:MAG: hypothetical protein WAZ12_01110 [Candidatus Absconditicoccaceae bacterium]